MIYVKDILEICNGTLLCGNADIECKSFCNDTRTIKKNDVYVGVKGESFNGNDFYLDAFKNGANVCLLDNGTNISLKEGTIILVENTLDAIKKLAKYKRDLFDIPVIAITGSVGKTSVKDMIYGVLSKKYKVLCTQGNKNNHIGLPLTILSLNKEKALILEMGMNHFGEIHDLSNIANPTIGIITNIGTAHIGNLGSRENILKAKLEILDGMFGNPLIVNNDNDLLKTVNYENLITIGIDTKSDYMAHNINDLGFSSNFYIGDTFFNLRVGSKASVYNALFAYAVGKKLGINNEDIKDALEDFKLAPHRLDVFYNNGYSIIDDTYNASLDSVNNSIELLCKINTRKVAILADILELGVYSKEIHQTIGELIQNNTVDVLITVGKDSKYINQTINRDNIIIYHFETNDELLDKIDKILDNGDTILIKGSHAMKLNEIVDYLKRTSK